MNGVTIEQQANWHLVISTPGTVQASFITATNDSSPENRAPKPGDRMRDGTVYAVVSPDTHRPMYTMPRDAPLRFSFNEAAEYARYLNAEKYLGRDDWRVPTKDELNVLFNNREAIGGFEDAGWYWSSTKGDYYDALTQHFSDGTECWNSKYLDSSLRCVRG